LDVARAALKAAMSPEDGGQDAVVTDESVKLAIPNRTPTSPKGFVILGLSFMLGLMAGIGLAVWRDKRAFEPRETLPSLSAGFLLETPLFDRLGVGLASLVQRAREILAFHVLRSGNSRCKPGHHQEIVTPGESDQPARRDANEADVVVCRAGAVETSNTTTLLAPAVPPPNRRS
jgi:hypothetical protein